MGCTICGKATGPGALLCRPCKSALKRARQYTMLEMPGTPPAVTLAGLPSAPPRRKVAARAPVRPKRRTRSWTRLALAGVAAVALLAGAAYVNYPRDSGRGLLAMPMLAPVPRPAATPDGVSNPERVSDFAPARGKD